MDARKLPNLINEKRSFVLFAMKNGTKWEYEFKWDEKKKRYFINGRAFKGNLDDILKVPVHGGRELKEILECGNVIEFYRSSSIEKEIIDKYIVSSYRERCKFLLSHKEKCQNFAGYFHSDFQKFNREKLTPVNQDSYEVIKKELILKRLYDKEGYLITGYIFFCDFFTGKIGELLEYMRICRSDDFGILYCSNKIAILQVDLETEKQRLYWLKE
jgi:hypothetical protein